LFFGPPRKPPVAAGFACVCHDGLMTEPQAPTSSQPHAFSAGVVVVRREDSGWRLLVLRAYRNWDFPKGTLEPGESPLDAALRETMEEATISDLAFRWGEGYCETVPYRHGKVARYYLAETTQTSITLPVSPELGRPEHDEWRWVSFDEAESLLPPRLQPILAWARKRLEA
jgi:8-oxo-dGTP pyrophosphatase MutT (NUDIX family)